MAFQRGPNMVTNGLVLALDAANPRSYVSGSAIWYDRSGNNNGTLINGPVFDSSSLGSIAFDGIDDYVLTPYSGSATGDFTFSVWALNSTISDKVVASRGRDGRGSGFSGALSFQATGNLGAAIIANGVQFSAIGGSYTSNQWYNITGVWKSGISISLYVNGYFVSQTNTSNTILRSSTDGWVLASITTSLYYSVKVANLIVYDRALTDLEVLQNYRALKSRYNPE